jgi:serine/threonine protein kinase/Zn-finger nucleic acid-binding protein
MIGTVLGNHRIVAKIGEGGMGMVYLAEHQVIGRKAAIKVLHERASADGGTVESFFDEARAANQVRHPGIVDIYDCGYSEEAGPYLVMEYLEGESLATRLALDWRLHLEEASRILEEVALVLATVHQAGIVHRDLKPGNIYLLSDDDRVKVLDFGIALLLEKGQRLTDGLRIMGTPNYMAPEQCAGQWSLDIRTDIYALGVIAYEMLAGRVPFEDPDYKEILRMHRAELPRSIRSLNLKVPKQVEAVVMRALAKEPSSRFPTIMSFANAFATACGRPPRQLRPPRRPARRPPNIPPTKEADTLSDPGALDRELDGPEQHRGCCPHCPDRLLRPVKFGYVEVDACPICKGIWFDVGEVEDAASESLGAGYAGPVQLAFSLGERVEEVEMRCPSCEEPLVTYRFASHGGLEVEICELCGGVWLEHGEFAQVQRQRAEQILERLTGKRVELAQS